MRCVIGIDLGSTTTKAVLLDESGDVLGRGVTNSRSNYETACAVAREETLTSARFALLGQALESERGDAKDLIPALRDAFRLELFLVELTDLRTTILRDLERNLLLRSRRSALEPAVIRVLDGV